MFGLHHVRGYHPLLATVAGTGEVVHSRLRGGNAHTARGAASFLTEAFNRVRAAGATGPLTLAGRLGLLQPQGRRRLRAADVRFSITAKLFKGLNTGDRGHRRVRLDAHRLLLDGADVAETTYRPFGKKAGRTRLIVRRVRPTPGSQLALFTEFSYHAFITDRPATCSSSKPTTAVTPRSRTSSATSNTAWA